MTLLAISLIFLALTKPSEAINCGQSCQCLKVGFLYRAECSWGRILPESLRILPQEKISQLVIDCQSKQFESKLTPGMFAKFTNLEQLKINGCFTNKGKVNKDIFTGLRQLKKLTLHDCGSADYGLTFEPGVFKPLRDLDQLTITDSRLTGLPERSLCDFQLKSLNLSGNFIREISLSGLVGCPTSLILLDLSRNWIQGIEKETFIHMKYLHRLHLSSNAIEQIPTLDAFKGLTSVKVVDLSKNKLPFFDQDLRSSTPNLHKLDLSFNKIGKIELQLGLLPPNLRKLSVSNNNAVLSSDFALDAEGLDHLDLSHNHIGNLQPGFIRNATNLRKVRLHHNKIMELDLLCFVNAENLEYLDLHRNQISSSPVRERGADDTQILHRLQILRLDDNLLKDFDFLQWVPNLRELNMAKNNMEYLHGGIDAVRNTLEVLELQENKMRQIYGFTLEKFKRLRLLNVSRNAFTKLDEHALRGVKSLEIVDVSFNHLTMLPEFPFDGSTQVSEIHLAGNKIKLLTTHIFGSMDSLRVLDLSSNALSYVDLSFFTQKLVTLDLSRNSITGFERNVDEKRVESLENLDLSRNNLQLLSYAAYPPSIINLNLSHNQLLLVNQTGFLSSRPHLKNLDLRHNGILHVTEESILTQNPDLNLYLSGNPFQCSCHNTWLKKLPNSQFPNILGFEGLQCHSVLNPNYPPQPLSSVHEMDFLCPYEHFVYESEREPCLCRDSNTLQTPCDCVSVCPFDCKCFKNNDGTEDVIDCRQTTKEVNIHHLPFFSTRWFLDGVRNMRKVVPKHFARTRLREIHLNGSGIAEIVPEAYKNLKALQFVNLSDNLIQEIPYNAFRILPKLKFLYLANNKLRDIAKSTFDNVSGLQIIDLRNNEFRTLPSSIQESKPGTKYYLGGNPWKCDCDDKYAIQSWIRVNHRRVLDTQDLYCFEDAPFNTTNATVLSSFVNLNGDKPFKMNMWSFFNKIQKKQCSKEVEIPEIVPQEPPTLPITPSSGALLTPSEPNTSVEEAVETFTKKHQMIIYVTVGVSVTIVLVFILVVVCFFKDTLREKFAGPQKMYKKPFTSAGEMSPVSSANASIYAPHNVANNCGQGEALLCYDAFLACSVDDSTFVNTNIAQPLEQELPYYQLCLLYRDVYNPQHTLSRNHMIDDLITDSMAKCQIILLVLTEAFLKNEWESAQVRTALHFVAKDKRRRLVAIFLDDLRLDQIDPFLGQYLRTSVCIHYNDSMFWEKLKDALPDKVLHTLNDNLSSAYYGTIVPSDFV